ncbi:Putative FAD/NAD(P)-binding domain superfamily [Septoria linicola]|uniref:FAD/NAD(P)-binding domain superfamily n=1 Tax=Septoria linicola TaxID=215465 RepID=A0A9Q9ATG0_9PEZI|nr:Putative FAD/NAD(P)-binding domain superfamily [Septoria linicola]
MIDEHAFFANNIIESDVAILGAGASGTFAAVRLREDYNLKVTVIEKQDRIGGHTHTYNDPATNKPVDYGVLSFWDYGPAKDFFARLRVEITPPPPPTGTSIYVDAENAKNLTGYKDPPFPNVLSSIGIYGNQSEKYNDILLPGYWNFPSRDAIPEGTADIWGVFQKEE